MAILAILIANLHEKSICEERLHVSLYLVKIKTQCFSQHLPKMVYEWFKRLWVRRRSISLLNKNEEKKLSVGK